MSPQQDKTTKSAQKIAIIMAATGVFWIVATWLGPKFGLSMRIQALFDLAVLAGFGFCLWQTYLIWRDRQND